MDDNTYECPNCGAQVYPEQTRCSQCGQNMYPEDEPEATSTEQSVEPGWTVALGAVLIGWMIASGVALVVNFIVASFIPASMLGNTGKFILFMAAFIGALVGGYICAGLVKRYAIALGTLIGILAVLVTGLLTTRWVEVTPALLLSPLMITAGVLIVLAGLTGGWLNQTFAQSGDWKEKWRVRGWEDLLYQELLRKVRFNGSAADRLIDYERKQDPAATRLKLIQNAIERLDRDNR